MASLEEIEDFSFGKKQNPVKAALLLNEMARSYGLCDHDSYSVTHAAHDLARAARGLVDKIQQGQALDKDSFHGLRERIDTYQTQARDEYLRQQRRIERKNEWWNYKPYEGSKGPDD